MKKNYPAFILLLSLAGVKFINAGSPLQFVSSADPFGTRVFIENKGQFNTSIKSNDKVFFAFENGEEKIYFTNTGVVYKHIKRFMVSEDQKEAAEKGKSLKLKPDVNCFVEMKWANANPNIEIESNEKTNYYFTYGAKELISYGYKKIIYKNVYNDIDIEYIIPVDKGYGIKYSVIVHPGGNPSEIKMVYSGDFDKMSLTKSGDIIIKTPLDNLIEHVPFSFDENNNEVASAFVLENNTISFNFPNGFQTRKTLTIDPWVTTITTLATNNYGYDVDYDNAGNLFVYGGTTPWLTSKYNSAGVLQWTFAGIVVAPPWNGSGATNYVSNFCVNRITGKPYIGQGWVPATGCQVIRLTTAGVYDNFMTVANLAWQEVWDMGIQCTTGNLYGIGGCPSTNQSCGQINETTGAVVVTSFMAGNASASQDLVSTTMDVNGNPFVYYTSSNVAIINTLAKINTALTNTVWAVPSTYLNMTYCAMKSSYVAPFAGNSNGYNCLAVNNNYLYYYDGFNLAAYNKLTGAKIAFTTIAANVLKAEGGIEVDDCDNLYLGGNNSILSYHFTGAVFNVLPSIPLAAPSVNKYVFDIKLDRPSSTLYATGSGFVGVYSAVNSLTCAVPPSVCFIPLPVEMISFSGKAVDRTVVLNWTTAMELNSDYFVVERSADGILFEELGTVKAFGNSHQNRNYEFVDNNPNYGNINYYRLREVDTKGKVNFSNSIVISPVGLLNVYINVYPVPAEQSITIEYNGDDTPSNFKIFNSLGILIFERESSGKEKIELNTLQAGTYQAVLQNQYQTITKKFLVLGKQ